ncbi:nucleotide-binding universal stress UspA family protein [Salegentibacter sp. 24]|uniref:universal stress protein n=1 Tax=Salegentibacter sp. 24 TaxID=2183986 RepID=UPI001060BE09|nr:universal stress protein [Salegentibacter sp. 24]TDN87274.1 nucleotide-binding universal stress UspA family protein [Salegentibacter sp. 24]
MKKILLPTDFSLNAYNAIKYGIQLFHKEKCEFYLLNTYTPALYNFEYIVSTNLSIEEVYTKNSEKGLSKVLKRIKKEFPNDKHTYNIIPAFNTLTEEIKFQVKEKGINFVIMGTQGASRSNKYVIGTQTVHAIKSNICPLLAIPSKFKYTLPKNILFATDYENFEIQTYLPPLKEIAKKSQATIHILHMIEKAPLKPEQVDAKNQLISYFKNIPHYFYELKQETVVKAINQFRKEKSIDLLAMVGSVI